MSMLIKIKPEQNFNLLKYSFTFKSKKDSIYLYDCSPRPNDYEGYLHWSFFELDKIDVNKYFNKDIVNMLDIKNINNWIFKMDKKNIIKPDNETLIKRKILNKNIQSLNVEIKFNIAMNEYPSIVFAITVNDRILYAARIGDPIYRNKGNGFVIAGIGIYDILNQNIEYDKFADLDIEERKDIINKIILNNKKFNKLEIEDYTGIV